MAQYYPPYGSTAANAPYVNGDPSNAVEGSIPDARGFESTQREIVSTITAAGLTPSGSDLTQLLQAIRGGQLDFMKDASTAANTVLLTPSVPYLALAAGNRFRFRAAFAPTGDSVVQVGSNLPPVGIRMAGGAKVPAGAWSAGDMVTLEFDGTYAQLRSASGGGGSGSLIPSANVILQVPSQYPTIQAAVIAASAIFLPIGVFGQIQVAAGYIEYLSIITGPIQLPGQFGERWSLVGPALNGSFPSATDIAGRTNAQTLTLLRTRFQVEIRCSGTGAFTIRSGVWSQIANILVSGDQTAAGGFYGIKVGDWSTRVGMAALGLLNVAVHGFGLDNIRAEQSSVIQGVNVCSTYSTAHNIHVSHYSVFEVNTGNVCSMYGQTGVALQNYGIFAIDSASGTVDLSYNQDGVASPSMGEFMGTPSTGLRVQNNIRYGFYMSLFSSVGLSVNGSTQFGGNGTLDINCNLTTTTATFGCSLPKGASPARGSGAGNQQSYVL